MRSSTNASSSGHGCSPDMCRSSQKPGDYFLYELENESVIVLRDQAGTIRAFHNHCRHRGSRLCREAHGTIGNALVCPYHAWSYSLDGKLRNVPAMSEVPGFDAADYPLHGVALHEWEGFVFLNFAKQPLPFEQALPGLAGRFKQWQTARNCARRIAAYTTSTPTGRCSCTTSASAITARWRIRSSTS